jgi:dipeptidyl aminopeptidase/acylaminoacyl peptidase
VQLDGYRVSPLTSAGLSIDRYDLGRNRVVYRAAAVNRLSTKQRDNPHHDAEVITGRTLQEILFPSVVVGNTLRSYTLGVLTESKGRWIDRRVPGFSITEGTYIDFLYPFVLSSQGDKLITMTPAKSIPISWQQYEPAPGFKHLRFGRDNTDRLSAANALQTLEYSIVDLKTGESRPLLHAPNARALGYTGNNRATWSRDGQHVLLTNTLMDLEQSADTQSATYPCAVASIELRRLTQSCLFFLTSDRLRKGENALEIRAGGDNQVSVLIEETAGKRLVDTYLLRHDGWVLRSSVPFYGYPDQFLGKEKSEVRSKLTLSVRQNLNLPPALWASDDATGIERVIWNPNPQLGHVAFGPAAVYRWKDRTGDEWIGGLIKPVGYVPSRRYPLVIQMYSFRQDQFITDGTDPTAFAARELASVGFVVLEIQRKPTTLTGADTEASLRGYRSAIHALDDAGLIDPARVGVVGFSRTCWFVWNALIKDPKLFAAATIADGNTNSYMEYMLFGNGGYLMREQDEYLHGGTPFGKGLQRWIDTSVAFHLDQVKTPVRLEAMAPFALLDEWEAYTALYLQGKPIDFIYFPQGLHIHQRPQERLESQQGNIDWMRFWLQDYEDPDPAKVGQYARWRQWKTADAAASR